MVLGNLKNLSLSHLIKSVEKWGLKYTFKSQSWVTAPHQVHKRQSQLWDSDLWEILAIDSGQFLGPDLHTWLEMGCLSTQGQIDQPVIKKRTLGTKMKEVHDILSPGSEHCTGSGEPSPAGQLSQGRAQLCAHCPWSSIWHLMSIHWYFVLSD